jgi:hypothetical protein
LTHTHSRTHHIYTKTIRQKTMSSNVDENADIHEEGGALFVDPIPEPKQFGKKNYTFLFL